MYNAAISFCISQRCIDMARRSIHSSSKSLASGSAITAPSSQTLPLGRLQCESRGTQRTSLSSVRLPTLNGSTSRYHSFCEAETPRFQNPLSRLSDQLKRIPPSTSRSTPNVSTSASNWSGLEPPPFRTLNTKSLLYDVTSKPQYSRESSLHADPSDAKHVQRTLPLKSEIDSYLERAGKKKHEAFASRFYDQQYWHNKERGGPINRKHSADGHTLLQRYRIRQKTTLMDNLTVNQVERSLKYQEDCKNRLQKM